MSHPGVLSAERWRVIEGVSSLVPFPFRALNMNRKLAPEGPQYEIRGAVEADEEQILSIARHLNTVNLPDQREGVQQILALSQKSFTGAIKDPKRRQYVF